MASSRSLGALSVDVIAKVGGFTKGMTQAERQADKSSKAIEQRMRGLSKGIDAALKVAAVGIVGGATALTLAFKNAVDGADELSKTAQKIGITTESLSTLGYAAGLADVELGELQAGLGRLTKFQSEAAQGTEKNVELFARLGIAYRETNGSLRDTGEVFREVAEYMAGMASETDKAALAQELLGRSGANLLPLLNAGGKGIAELEERARRLGLELSESTGKNAEELNDRLSDLWSVVDGLAYTVAADLLPDIIELTDALTDTIREGGGMVEVGRDIADIFRGLAQVAGGAGLAIEGMGERFNIAAQYKNAFLDPAGWQQYQAEIDKSNARLSSLADESKALALLARQNFGIDPKVMPIEDGSMPRSGRGRPRGTPMQDGETQVINAGDLFGTGGGSGSGRGPRAQREETESTSDYVKELKRAADEERDQMDRWKGLVATLNGPLAEAEFEHAQRLEQIRDAGLEAGASSTEISRALDLEAEAHTRNVEAIKSQQEPLAQLLADMAFENDLLGKTNAARIVELELRRLGLELDSEEGQAAAARIKARVEERDALELQVRALDDFRSSFEDNVAGVLDGSKSIKDALRDLVDDLISQLARAAAQSFTENLFGEPGTKGGGTFGDLLGSFLGSFGGGRASGGPIYPGKAYLVGEEGPELIRPMGAGMVSTAGETARMGRGGVTQNVTFSLPGKYDMRTQAQISSDMHRLGQRAVARGSA